MSKAPQVFLIHQCDGGGEAGGVFRALFWIHQVVLGLPSVFFALDLLIKGRTDGIINVIGIFLAWIGGTLVFGLAAIMHQRLSYSLPPVFTNIADSIARFETMQTHANALSAVAEAVETRANSAPQKRQFPPPVPADQLVSQEASNEPIDRAQPMSIPPNITLRYAVYNDKPAIFSKNAKGDVLDAYWFVNNGWLELHPSEAATNAKLIGKESFDRAFPNLPPLPDNAWREDYT
jgi:hypothetical protein